MSDDIVDRLAALGDKLRYDWAGLNDPPVTVAEEAADEIVRLRKWKSEASIVIDRWEAAWESAGSPGQLGDAKSDALRDEIVRLRAEVAQLTAERDDANEEIASCRVLEWIDVAGELFKAAKAMETAHDSWCEAHADDEDELACFFCDALAAYEAAHKEEA